MKKRLLSVITALLLILPAGANVSAASFSDIKDEALLKAVQTLNSLGAVADAEKFNSGGQLSRAMFCSIAVPLSGITDVTPYKNYTVFPDVRASHWALGYVNAAVKELKLLGSRPNGTFAPDEGITYDEAITIMVRMLGYSETDLGYNWPRNYLGKAAALGLTEGVAQTKTLTRAQGALLFYNMLYTDVNGETKPYIESKLGITTIQGALVSDISNTGRRGAALSDGTFYPSREKLDESLEGKTVDLIIDGRGYILGIEPRGRTIKNVVISKIDAAADDGTPGIAADDDTGFHPTRSALSESVNGRRVDLVLDSDGFVVSAEPLVQSGKTIKLAVADAMGVTGEDGVTFIIPPSMKVYADGSATTYSAAWANMKKGEEVTIYYKGSGATDYVFWNKPPEPLTKTLENVILLDTDAKDDDGNTGVLTDSGDFYPLRGTIGAALEYTRVNLILDAMEYAVAAEPVRQTSKTVKAALISAMGVTAENGATSVISPSAAVYVDGSATTYSAAYSNIKKGDELIIYYKNGGFVDYLAWIRNSGDGADVTTATATRAGAAGIQAALGVKPDGLTIIKNGVKVTADCVQPYDTLRYSGKTITISSLRISAVCPGGAPAQIAGLNLVPAASLQAQKFSYGDRAVLCVSTDGVVGAVVSNAEAQANAAGYMKDGGTVELMNGLLLSCTPASGVYAGMPVSVSFSAGGEAQAGRLMLKPGSDYNVSDASMGTQKVAEWCKYYTMSGDMVSPADKSGLPKTTVSAERIKHVYAGAGGIEIMIIEDLNGDAFSYGYVTYIPATEEEAAGLTFRTYTGAAGRLAIEDNVKISAPGLSGSFAAAGITVSEYDGGMRVNSLTRCLSYSVLPSELSGEYIMINGTMTPISDDCLEYGAYIRRDGKTVTIADVPDVVTSSSTLLVYCDKAPSAGGKVRWIEIR